MGDGRWRRLVSTERSSFISFDVAGYEIRRQWIVFRNAILSEIIYCFDFLVLVPKLVGGKMYYLIAFRITKELIFSLNLWKHIIYSS